LDRMPRSIKRLDKTIEDEHPEAMEMNPAPEALRTVLGQAGEK